MSTSPATRSLHDAIHEIARRYPGTDLAIVHLGGTTLPGGLMVTMDGRQGAELLSVVAARRAVPVHFDDYEAFKSPLADFRAEVEKRGLADRVTYVDRGGVVAL